MHLHLAPTL